MTDERTISIRRDGIHMTISGLISQARNSLKERKPLAANATLTTAQQRLNGYENSPPVIQDIEEYGPTIRGLYNEIDSLRREINSARSVA